MQNEIVTLIATDAAIADAWDEPVETGRRDIFARRDGVTRSEFYTAAKAGRKIDEVFTVNALDYDREIYLIYEGEEYEVVRAYKKDTDELQLSCERRATR